MHRNYDGLFSTANWQLIVFTLAAFYALFLIVKSSRLFLNGSKSQYYGWILTIAACIYIGTRPLWAYTDTALYTLIFRLVQSGAWKTLPVEANEWFWNALELFCIKNTSASTWLFIIATTYVGGMCWAAWRWMRNHFTLAVFFLFTAFSFWGYATNGIRNGMATSLVMLGLAFVKPEYRKNWIKLLPTIILIILGCGTHNSMYLLGASSLLAFFFPSRKAAFWVWGICLFLSPFSTHTIVALGGSFIEDQRFSSYGNQIVDDKLFSRTGWRWDFIIYSAMPIILGYYVIIKKKFYDWTYVFLLSVYMYANSFWLLINEVSYSNRYAYLSWFLYPIVLLMPMVKFRIWKNQPIIVGGILLASIAFSLIF